MVLDASVHAIATLPIFLLHYFFHLQHSITIHYVYVIVLSADGIVTGWSK